MAIGKIVEVESQITIYKHPVISIITPASWIDEAYRYQAYRDSVSGNTRWGGAAYKAIYRLGSRALASYIGLKDQWIENNLQWIPADPFVDFTLTYEGQKIDYKVHTSPETDWAPKYGKVYVTNAWKSKKSPNPLIHIFQTYSTPIINTIGVIPNSELDSGKNRITQDNLYPIYSDKVFRSHDQRCMYV